MLRDTFLLQGAAMLVAIDRAGPLLIRELTELHTSAYELRSNRQVARVLFKIATSRAGRHRWQFTVGVSELDLIRRMSGVEFPFFLALVCQKDGVCCVSHDDLFSLISDSAPTGQALSVTRAPRGSYWVSGPAKNSLQRSIPISDWPERLFEQNP